MKGHLLVATVLIAVSVSCFAQSPASDEPADPIAETQDGPPQEPPYTTAPDVETRPKTHEEISSVRKRPTQKVEPGRLSREKGLVQVTKAGEYIYKTKTSEQKNALSLRFGSFTPPNLANADGTLYFSDIYGTDSRMIVFFDYEWQFLKVLGTLGIKVGTGFFTTTGKGRFRSHPERQAEEVYTFVLFPNNAGLIYRMKIWDKQPIVPHIEGGADYFTFAEIRDDQARTKFGGAAAFHVSVGGSLALDFLSRQSMLALDRDYGINHVYITGDYRIVRGVNSTFDFSENIFSGGLTLEF